MSEVFEQVMALCARGSFTGWLRVQTREGNGEVRFVSGIQDGVRFDTLTGDAALARLESASEPEFEAVAALPPIDKHSQSPVAVEGGLDRIHAATLMRYCESNSLTCALELEADGQLLTARYRLGELLSVEPDSELTAQLAEAKQGVYRFKLPRFELPASVRSAKAAAPASTGTPAVAPVAARPAAPNVAAAFKPAAAPAVQPVRIAPAPHTRPTPAATPAAVRAVPSGVSSARTPAAPAATAAAARAASSPAAAASRPAASAAASPSPARPGVNPAVNAEPVRPAPIAEVRAAPVAEPIRAVAVAPAAARAPEPAAVASPTPAAAAARAPAASPAAEKAPLPKAPAPAAPAAAKPAAAARSQAITGEGRAASPARPAAARPHVQVQQECAPQRYGLVVVMALVAVALVVWVVLGAPLPVH